MSTTLQPYRTLLVVDDEPDLRQLIAEHIESAGYACVVCADGSEALRAVADHEIDAVLCDMTLPGSSGIDLLIAMRQSGVTLPFIFMTGFNAQSSADKAGNLGVFEFLIKPFDFDVMEATIRRVLDKAPLPGERRVSAPAA